MLINQLLKSVSNYQIKNDDDLLIQYVNPSIDWWLKGIIFKKYVEKLKF